MPADGRWDLTRRLKGQTFVIKAHDDGSDEPKYVAQCCMALKCCVSWYTSFLFQFIGRPTFSFFVYWIVWLWEAKQVKKEYSGDNNLSVPLSYNS